MHFKDGLNLMSFHKAHIPESDLVELFKEVSHNVQYFSIDSKALMHRVAL